jgi:hypothetical protein
MSEIRLLIVSHEVVNDHGTYRRVYGPPGPAGLQIGAIVSHLPVCF